MAELRFLCVLLLHVVYSCTPPFESVDEGCYYYSGSQGTYVDSYDAAALNCGNIGGRLAMVQRGEKSRAIVQHFFNQSIPDDKILLGATSKDRDYFEWIDGTFVFDGFQSWINCRPSGNGECMGYSKDTGFLWDDFRCEGYITDGLLVSFLCEEPSVVTTTEAPITTTTSEVGTTSQIECTEPFVDMGIACFRLIEQDDEFEAAQVNCQSMDSHLAYIKSYEKQLVMEQFLTSTGYTGYVWLGARDFLGDGEIFWLDGTNVQDGYTNFEEMSGGGGVYTYGNYDWAWGDQSLTSDYYFLCERDIYIFSSNVTS